MLQWTNSAGSLINDIEKAFQTQLTNIETRSGKSLVQLKRIVQDSGLTKHGEIRDMLKRDLGLGHGDADTLNRYALDSLNPLLRRPTCRRVLRRPQDASPPHPRPDYDRHLSL